MPKPKKMSGGCSSCSMIGGCSCLQDKKGGKKKTIKVKKGGSIMGDILDSAKALSVPFSFILAKQTLQDKMDKHSSTKKTTTKKTTTKKNTKKVAKGGGNILNVMK